MRFVYKGLKAQLQPGHYISFRRCFLTIEATVEILINVVNDSEKFWKVAVDRNQVVLEL